MARVAIIGTGFIGRAWAISYARAGHDVTLWDGQPEAPRAALAYIDALLPDLAANELLDDPPATVRARMSAAPTLQAALDGADHVQENTFEDVAVKRDIFARLDAIAAPHTVLASSTSAILPSLFTEQLAGRRRCLVVHPLNPPYVIPAAEVVPAPWTDPEVVQRTAAFLRDAGHAPIVMKRELDGFVMNRLQGALLEEAFRLVAGGYASVEDVDIGLREGSRAALELHGSVRDHRPQRAGRRARLRRALRADLSPPQSQHARARRLAADAAGGRRRPAARAAGGETRRAPGLARPPADGAGGAQAARRARHRKLTQVGELAVASSKKVIITCAVTGAIHTPTMSPHLPVTPEEIAAAAVGAAEAGAAIVHLHARDPETGRPDQSPEAFARFLPRIKQQTNAVVNLTTGGAPFMTVDERVRPAATFKPEVASLNMGSMNFGLFPMLARYKEWKHDWEPKALEASRDLVFRNTFKDIEFVLRTLGDAGTRFEFECYDTSHLYNLSHFLDRGLVKPPLFVQTVFGILGGIGAHPEDVAHMKRTADRLFGNHYKWSVLGAGRNQLPVAAMAAAMGGNVRVGLEDSLWAGPGKLAESNAQQVRLARQIIEGLGLEIATADEAREILQLKGGDKVAF